MNDYSAQAWCLGAGHVSNVELLKGRKRVEPLVNLFEGISDRKITHIRDGKGRICGSRLPLSTHRQSVGSKTGMSRGTYKSLTNQSQEDPLVPLQWSNLRHMSQ